MIQVLLPWIESSKKVFLLLYLTKKIIRGTSSNWDGNDHISKIGYLRSWGFQVWQDSCICRTEAFLVETYRHPWKFLVEIEEKLICNASKWHVWNSWFKTLFYFNCLHQIKSVLQANFLSFRVLLKMPAAFGKSPWLFTFLRIMLIPSKGQTQYPNAIQRLKDCEFDFLSLLMNSVESKSLRKLRCCNQQNQKCPRLPTRLTEKLYRKKPIVPEASCLRIASTVSMSLRRSISIVITEVSYSKYVPIYPFWILDSKIVPDACPRSILISP